jgi:hypothetical protein
MVGTLHRDQSTAIAAARGAVVRLLGGHQQLSAPASGGALRLITTKAGAAGRVEPGGIALHDGNVAGTGDWIVTRRNCRRLVTSGGRDWVKNGDAWQVVARDPSGALTIRRLGTATGGTTTIPAAYAAADVELLYATTEPR